MMEFLDTYHLTGIVVGAATFLIIGIFHPIVIKGDKAVVARPTADRIDEIL